MRWPCRKSTCTTFCRVFSIIPELYLQSSQNFGYLTPPYPTFAKRIIIYSLFLLPRGTGYLPISSLQVKNCSETFNPNLYVVDSITTVLEVQHKDFPVFEVPKVTTLLIASFCLAILSFQQILWSLATKFLCWTALTAVCKSLSMVAWFLFT